VTPPPERPPDPPALGRPSCVFVAFVLKAFDLTQ